MQQTKVGKWFNSVEQFYFVKLYLVYNRLQGGHFVLLLCRDTPQLMEKHILKIRLLLLKKFF